jgi:adenylosuccinate lyase
MSSTIPNVLADRYASPAMRNIWSPSGRILLEREFWIAVLKSQSDLGLPVADGAIEAYEAAKTTINLAAIDERERITRHDVKARIEEFNELAGFEEIHKGMTSRDLTENVEQMQVYQSLQLIRDKSIAALHGMAKRALEWKDLTLTGRTHNVAAQPITYGKRIAMFGEELTDSLARIEHLLATYSVRGLKGAVGTQMDQLSLFDGDQEKVAQLDAKVCKHLGMPDDWVCVGQVYPRSLDLRVVSNLVELAAGPSSFCTTLRLMSGNELASEGFAKGQTGSSAMPHKMNARSCERINGFHVILKGYQTMAAGLSGVQWNEGDVSCSVVRRIMLPDSFYATDGLFETFLTILGQMDAYPGVVASENERYLPFLLTTTIMMAAVKAGVGRETAHEVIKEHAVATVHAQREGQSNNDLLQRLAEDERLPLTLADLEALLEKGRSNVGAANGQIDHFVKSVEELCSKNPDAASYSPGSIL